jgi:hypothetical protein
MSIITSPNVRLFIFGKMPYTPGSQKKEKKKRDGGMLYAGLEMQRKIRIIIRKAGLVTGHEKLLN